MQEKRNWKICDLVARNKIDVFKVQSIKIFTYQCVYTDVSLDVYFP